jgi:hypothetical protein
VNPQLKSFFSDDLVNHGNHPRSLSEASFQFEKDTSSNRNTPKMVNSVEVLRAEGQSKVHIGNNVYQTNDQCLADLRSTDPRHDKTRIEQTKGGLLKDSYKWILTHADFRRWRDDEHSRLLWIKGDAGKGKTMLLIGIIDELLQRLEESTTDTSILSYFFCQGTDSRLNNATAVLRGLIYLLLDQQPSLTSHLQKKYDHAGRQLFEDANAFYALSQIFRDILGDPSLTGAYLIIDGLDECETGLEQLLGLITQTACAPSSHVKLIVSSRYKDNIEERLRLDDTRMRLSLELNAEHVSHAVDVYIDHKVSELALIKHCKTLQDQVRDKMRQKADGTFLWVAFVFEELQDVLSGDVLQVLEEVPGGLIPLYDRMIKQIQQLKLKYPEFCRLILSTATLAYRPLHLLELRILAGLERKILHIAELERMIKWCGSFLIIREDHVFLIHQSAKDYLSNNISAKIFPAGRANVHYDLFSRSLSALSQTLRRDIYDLRLPGLLIDQVIPVNPDPLAPVRYSCVYWVDHLCEVDDSSSHHKSEVSDEGVIFEFLKKHFLHWLESLSLLGKISDGISMIRKLLRLVQVCPALQLLHSSS